MRLSRSAGIALLVLALASCRGERPRPVSPDTLSRLVDSLRPRVERATGLSFKSPPRSALRTRQQVRQYLLSKLDDELPKAKLEGLETAYRLFGLLPDTLDLRPLLLELYTEQVAGYYDPDSATLFGVVGADPAQLRVVVAHEMVHALQGERLPLDSILHDKSNNDRLAAAQAVLEGQATLSGMQALFPPNMDPTGDPDFWNEYAGQIRSGQTSMPVFARAPLVVREALVFPYLAGAEFMHWWQGSQFKDTVPYGPRMPQSTEQVLFPERYAQGDRPIELEFPQDTEVMYQDVLGESELAVLATQLSGATRYRKAAPRGWAGDRYQVLRTPNGPALVWCVVWDNQRSAERFTMAFGGKLRQTQRKGYRTAFENIEIEKKPATLYVLAPEAWKGWSDVRRPTIHH